MKPRIKYGMLVGAGGLFMGICPATAFVTPFCGGAFLGGLAGYLAVNEEKPHSKYDGTIAGAIAGCIAGLITTSVSAIFTRILSPSTLDIESRGWLEIYYFLQVVNLFLSIGIGAVTGYLGTRSTTPTE